MKKFTRDIIILHMCTKNHNHMMYGSLDKEWDRHNFWTIFCPFTTPPPPPIPPPPNDQENQNFEKKKKMKNMPGDIILFYIHLYYK